MAWCMKDAIENMLVYKVIKTLITIYKDFLKFGEIHPFYYFIGTKVYLNIIKYRSLFT